MPPPLRSRKWPAFSSETRPIDFVPLPRYGTYGTFEYTGTQAIAAAAHFLEFDGLIVPSARASDLNLVLFTERLNVEIALTVEERNGRLEHMGRAAIGRDSAPVAEEVLVSFCQAGASGGISGWRRLPSERPIRRKTLQVESLNQALDLARANLS